MVTDAVSPHAALHLEKKLYWFENEVNDDRMLAYRMAVPLPTCLASLRRALLHLPS